MKEKIHRCDHIGIFTNNSKRLVNFYVNKLGFKKGMVNKLPKSIMKPLFGVSCECKFIKLYSEGVMIEIFEPMLVRGRKRTNNTLGYNHWGYCVANKEKFIQKMRRKKANIIEVKRNGRSVYFVTDPDANRIEIRDDKK